MTIIIIIETNVVLNLFHVNDYRITFKLSLALLTFKLNDNVHY